MFHGKLLVMTRWSHVLMENTSVNHGHKSPRTIEPLSGSGITIEPLQIWVFRDVQRVDSHFVVPQNGYSIYRPIYGMLIHMENNDNHWFWG